VQNLQLGVANLKESFSQSQKLVGLRRANGSVNPLKWFSQSPGPLQLPQGGEKPSGW